jgi:threonyl-tRNA synthetase
MKKITIDALNQWNSHKIMDLIDLSHEKPKNIGGFLINNNLYDIRDDYDDKNSDIFLIEKNDTQGLDIVRHSMAHLLAQSILYLYPDAKIAVGPTTNNGFFYDIDLDVNLTFNDLKSIEKTMNNIIQQNIPIAKKILSRLDAIQLFKEKNQDYKVILLENISSETVTIYTQGDFMDLCRGPHVYSTGSIPQFFQLYNIAEVDWHKGGPKNRLQRIYGLGFNTKEDLNNYLKIQELQKELDHRKIGLENQLVTFHPEFCSGGAFWEPKGFAVYNGIIEYIRQTIKNHGYQEVKTPNLYHENLWKMSGHWNHYQDNMFKIAMGDDNPYFISPKPMNCPAHILMFKNRIRSYRDLPLRLAEFGSCCRNESSGSLDGLMRMREFVQDDAHIFCREDQIQEETVNFCNLLKEVYEKLGFKKIKVVISTRPAKSFGDDITWEKAEKSLMNAMDFLQWEYNISPGDGAFYGPKLEFSLEDRMGRYWQCGTFQVDFVLPQRMGAHYIDNNSQEHHPIICHRAILGSIERFLGILIENNKGHFPFWLTPIQLAIINISENQLTYGQKIYDSLKNSHRCQYFNDNETLGKKIRQSIKEKIPIMIIVGNEEMDKNTMVIRNIKGDQMVCSMDDINGKILELLM